MTYISQFISQESEWKEMLSKFDFLYLVLVDIRLVYPKAIIFHGYSKSTTYYIIMLKVIYHSKFHFYISVYFDSIAFP